MNKKSRRFIVTDILLIAGMILPVIAGILLKVLFIPASDGIEISGAHIFFTVELPFQPLYITESQVNSVLVIISVVFLCLYLTHGIKEKPDTRRQHVAEWIVEKTDGLVKENMAQTGAHYRCDEKRI